MAGIYGMIGLDDNEYAFVNSLDQRLVFEQVNLYLQMIDEEVRKASALFIEEQTTGHKELYLLPGGGRMSKIGSHSEGPSVKASGQWDVAYPLYEFGEQISYTRKSYGKLTVRELQRHLDTIQIRYINALRWEILHRILDNVQETFTDDDFGALLIEPLANNDTVVYPPVVGSETEATENHYLESGYAASAISDTNNPYVTLVKDIEHHFGAQTGGGNLVTLIHEDETPETIDLVDFQDVPDNFIMLGDDADTLNAVPMDIPGRIIGRSTGSGGSWISEYNYMPTGYMVTIDRDQPAPLKMRVPPTEWGWASALALVAENDKYPFIGAHYETNFGIGAGNRLNGVVMELGTGGTYTVPTAYT